MVGLDPLPLTQSGFRKKMSSNSALINAVDDILRETSKGNLKLLCLLDFTKAFNTLNHEQNFKLFNFHENTGFKLNTTNAAGLIFFGRISCITAGTNEFICCASNCIT